MTRADERRAIVIGAGIGGLSAAVALRRAGWAVAVYERARVIRPEGAALWLWPNAVAAVERLGVGAAVAAFAAPQAVSGIRDGRGRVLVSVPLPVLERRLGYAALAIRRAAMHRVLHAALPPGTVRLNATCADVTHDANAATAHFADGTHAHGDVVIVADGMFSALRGRLLGAAPPHYTGYTTWHGMTTYPHAHLPTGESWGRGERFGVAALDDGNVHWIGVFNCATKGMMPVEGPKAMLAARFAAWPAPIPALIAATDEAAILRSDVYDASPLPRWGAGRVTFLGDAAHPMTPNLGQGACMAIEDAVVLAQCLAHRRDVIAGLRRYERVRMRRTAAVNWKLRTYGQVAQWTHPLARAVRDGILRSIPMAVHHEGLSRMIGPAV